MNRQQTESDTDKQKENPLKNSYQFDFKATSETLVTSGYFPKYLTRIGDTLVFLDLASTVSLTVNGRRHTVEIFGWVMELTNNQFTLHSVSDAVNQAFPNAPEKAHTGKKEKESLLYVMTVQVPEQPIAYVMADLERAGRIYDNGHVDVRFGPCVIDEHFRVWAMSDRHKCAISNAADDWAAKA